MRNKIPEILWIVVAAMALATGLHKSINEGFAESWYFFVFVIIALFMHRIRKKMRQNSENP
jgi:surface polysaccharide O-acyltransferase-like enzyme